MKRTVKVKNLIAFAAVLILLFSLSTIPAHATWNPTSKNRFGAWLGSALLALNITMQSTVAPIEQMYEYIADPIASQIEYTYPATSWEDDIMNRAVIKIAPDSVIIDGVEYTDIWLSNNAAEKFRVNAFDFQTGYSLASNTNGTFASGYGYAAGLPLFDMGGGNLQTQSMEYLNLPASWNYGNITNSFQDGYLTSSSPYNTYFNNRYIGSSKTAVSNVITGNNRGLNLYWNFKPYGNQWVNLESSNIVEDPFDFDYVSGTIPPDEVLDPDYGMNIRVPSDTPGLQVFIQNNIDYTNDNGKYIDFNLDPDVKLELDDLIDIIAPILVDLDVGDITFNTIPDTPHPVPPQPVLPDTLFPDTTVDDALQPVINTINNNTQNIIEQIPSSSEISEPIIQEIQNTGDEIIENIPKIDEICNNIDTAPYHDLDTGLDRLPSFFLPFITDLRSALGIWHYVTEWLAQISTSFAFVSGCLVGTSIMTPIYAAIAGFMCIKIYRRMTA